MSNRKQKLQDRARRYATLRETGQHGYEGYQEGYRAAMRDLRKRIRNAGRDTAHIADPFKRVRVRHGFIAAEVLQFLRPLR